MQAQSKDGFHPSLWRGNVTKKWVRLGSDARAHSKQITLINPYSGARPFLAESKTDASGASHYSRIFRRGRTCLSTFFSLDTKTLYARHNAQISGFSCLLRGHVLRAGFHKFICYVTARRWRKKVYDFNLTNLWRRDNNRVIFSLSL